MQKMITTLLLLITLAAQAQKADNTQDLWIENGKMLQLESFLEK